MTKYAEPETKAPAVKVELPPDLLTTFEEPGDTPGFAKRLLAFIWLPIIKDYADENLDGALALANSVRYALGMPAVTKLMPGKRGDGSHCVIAETILFGYDGSKGSVAVGGGTTHVGEQVFVHPPEVHAFISKFDGGMYDALSNDRKN